MNYTNILANIPDKREDKNTTSLKFKQDLIEFFQPLQLKNCVEIGTSLGYSTRVLSFLFDTVTTIDIDRQNIQKALNFNSDRSNITFLHGNASEMDWDVDIKFDVSFIDADHLYKYVINDTKQSIKYGVDNMYIVFDDYGLPETVPAVKVAVDEMLSNNIIKFVKHIGEPAGSEPRIGRPLVDWEGMICQVA
jgi:hypothetical protein